MAKTEVPEQALPLTPAVFHILLVLTRADRHGYAIKQEVERFTDGALRLGPARSTGRSSAWSKTA